MQATLDQRVVGFRPERGVKVPVVPLIAEYEAWLDQSLATAAAGINDNFGFDPLTGQVTTGPDGIPESSPFAARRKPRPRPRTSRPTPPIDDR